MNHIHKKIDFLILLGLNFNLEQGKDWLISSLADYHEIDDPDYPLWLIAREMGNKFIVDKNLNEFSSNVTNIIFEDFFFYNKLSTILSELKRITNGAITYKVINEFDSLYNADNSRSTETIWNKLDQSIHNKVKNISQAICSYEICGQEFKFEYNFFQREPTVLNPEFVEQLCWTLEDIFLKNNINYYSAESITFFSTSQKNQELLAAEPTFFLNKQLVNSLQENRLKTKDEEEKREQEKLRQQEKEIKKRKHDYTNSNSLTRLATETEISRLENYKKEKIKDLILVILLSFVFLIILIWLRSTELFKIPLFYYGSYVILGLIFFFVLFVFRDLKLKSIKTDLNEKQIKRHRGVISGIFRHDGKTVIDFQQDCDVKKIILDYNISKIKEGDVINFEVFMTSNVFLKILNQ